MWTIAAGGIRKPWGWWLIAWIPWPRWTVTDGWAWVLCGSRKLAQEELDSLAWPGEPPEHRIVVRWLTQYQVETLPEWGGW